MQQTQVSGCRPSPHGAFAAIAGLIERTGVVPVLTAMGWRDGRRIWTLSATDDHGARTLAERVATQQPIDWLALGFLGMCNDDAGALDLVAMGSAMSGDEPFLVAGTIGDDGEIGEPCQHDPGGHADEIAGFIRAITFWRMIHAAGLTDDGARWN